MNKGLLIILVLTTAILAQAQTLSFDSVWKQVKAQSPVQEMAGYQKELSQEESHRAARHWLPRLYLDVRTFQSNDPGQNLFSKLQQRQIEATDFNPQLLNQPKSEIYTRGALGVDLPLFEGFMKSAQRSLHEHQVRAQELLARQTEIDLYSKVAEVYGGLVSVSLKIKKLNSVSDELKSILKNYRIGQKENPVGYSGLLGIRSLSNRVSGLLIQYQAQEKSYYEILKEMGVNHNYEKISYSSLITFLDKHLDPNSDNQKSLKLLAYDEQLKATQQMAKMERSRFLPRVGAFAEGYVFNGDRDLADGYTAGLYLQWSLFDPSDYGRHNEARLKSLVYQKQIEALSQQENIEKTVFESSKNTLRENLILAEQSEKIVNEQMQVSSRLFRSGSINALQLVEVLNRRVDVIIHQSDIEDRLLKIASDQIKKHQFEIATKQ